MLDYKQYYDYYYKALCHHTICPKIDWLKALTMKCILNVKGYSSYQKDPVLGFKFMKDSFTNYQDKFKKGNKKFIIDEFSNTFYEIDNSEIKNIGKFYNTDSGLSDMIYIINVGIGFCIFKIKNHSYKPKNSYRETSYSVDMEFYNNETINYLNNIPDEELGNNIVREKNGKITFNSLLDLFYTNQDNLKKYIIPEFQKNYIRFEKIPTTEPELTFFFENCFQDIRRQIFQSKFSRRKKK